MPVLQRRPRRAVDEDDDEATQRPRQRQRQNDDEAAQRPRQGQRQSDDDDDDEAKSHGSDDEGSIDMVRDVSIETVLVKKLVRYALACEYSRTTIRREGIREKVLGPNGRIFRKILEGAQKQLRAVFAMEMVELPTRDKDTMSLGDKRRAAKSQSKGQASSNAYILVSTLPDEYRSADIITPSKFQGAEEEAAYIGIYTFIIALITLHGSSISDAKLRRYLSRGNAGENMPGDKTDTVLQKLIKQGYLVKTVEKRQERDEESIIWSVGPRGKTEVGPEAVAGMVREIYGDTVDELELERKLQASLRIGGAQPADSGGTDEAGRAGRAGARASGSQRRRRSRRYADDDDED